MTGRNYTIVLLAVAAVFTFWGCKLTKLVPKDKYLLEHNSFKFTEGTNTFPGIKDYVRHKPNRKILGIFKLHLGFHRLSRNLRHPEKDTSNWFRRYMWRIGEKPVILDSVEVQHSANNLRNYMFNQGYYNSKVEYTVAYKRRKAFVTYHLMPFEPYRINRVALAADDADIDQILNDTMSNSKLKGGDILTVENIDAERNRLTLILRNKGYYHFTKEYTDFELDTLMDTHQVNVLITVANKSDEERFLPQRIGNVSVEFENDEETQTYEDSFRYEGLIFYRNGYPIEPEIISRNVYIRPGKTFTQVDLENTFNRLSELSVVKFIDVQFSPAPADSLNVLDAVIKIKTGFRQSFSIEPQGLLSQNNRIVSSSYVSTNTYGAANSIVYSHRNLFRNAEQFNLSTTTRAEFQAFSDTVNRLRFLKYTSFQQLVNASLLIPRSTILKPLEKNKNVYGIKTSFNLAFQYEYNPDFIRKILSATYSYQIQTRQTTWFFNPVEISFSRNNLSSGLKESLRGRSDSAFVARLFADNLITSTGLKFIYTNKNSVKGRSYFNIRGNLLELGGNIHRAVRLLKDNEQQADTSYKLFNVNYYQYAKTEIDIRYNTIFDENNSTVLRFNAGLAVPYGNQKVLPFDKLFFIGGSNSLRAWRPRTIGPGSYRDSTQSFRIDRSGDIVIQANAEYRFDLIDKFMEGAIFLDAGNIWNLRTRVQSRANELFSFGNFLPELAVNTGVGARFDFQFFMIRLDWGIQVRNPEKPLTERLVIKDFGRKGWLNQYSILNLGVGYPF